MTDETPLYNFKPEDIENFRQPERPAATQPTPTPHPTAAKPGDNTMNKAKLIAAIQKLGGTVANDATIEQLEAQFDGLLEAKSKPAPTPAPAPAPAADSITAMYMLDFRIDLMLERDALYFFFIVR